MNGKGMQIWKLKDVLGGNPEALVMRAKALGLSWVALKVANGTARYNLRLTPLGYVDDIVHPVVAAFHAVGIEVWGWQYAYLADGATEAERAVERVGFYGLDGLLIDAEVEAKWQVTAAKTYAGVLNQKLRGRVPIGLQSYRYPSYHPELPWRELLECCDFHCPQVYWVGANNPGAQLEKSVQELRGWKDVPVSPTGACYYEKGWQPRLEELDEFDQKAKELGCPGVLWYRWGHAIEYGYEDTIARHEWGQAPVEPVNPPVEGGSHWDIQWVESEDQVDIKIRRKS